MGRRKAVRVREYRRTLRPVRFHFNCQKYIAYYSAVGGLPEATIYTGAADGCWSGASFIRLTPAALRIGGAPLYTLYWPLPADFSQFSPLGGAVFVLGIALVMVGKAFFIINVFATIDVTRRRGSPNSRRQRSSAPPLD